MSIRLSAGRAALAAGLFAISNLPAATVQAQEPSATLIHAGTLLAVPGEQPRSQQTS